MEAAPKKLTLSMMLNSTACCGLMYFGLAMASSISSGVLSVCLARISICTGFKREASTATQIMLYMHRSRRQSHRCKHERVDSGAAYSLKKISNEYASQNRTAQPLSLLRQLSDIFCASFFLPLHSKDHLFLISTHQLVFSPPNLFSLVVDISGLSLHLSNGLQEQQAGCSKQ